MASAVLASLFHPSELYAIGQLKLGGQFSGIKSFRGDLTTLPEDISDIDFCYAVLNKVSRSFALVIQQLPEELKDCVCLFYLVLRGLDSVEDDLDVEQERKKELLNVFHLKMDEDGWNCPGVGDSDDYRFLMAKFEKVISCCKQLKPEYQEVIKEITQRMGAGMAKYVGTTSVKSVDDYNEYCHYVAGLVGIGLVKLFAASGLEDPSIKDKEELANFMGLFLQKTNIIRDYLEDLEQERIWWPLEVVERHGFEKGVGEVREVGGKRALDVLNDLVGDAVELIPRCLEFMSLLKDEAIFRFCAIPQVMAMATLQQLYNNPKVFQGVVKIRKGESCYLMCNSNNNAEFRTIFYQYSQSLLSKVKNDHYRSEQTRKVLEGVMEETKGDVPGAGKGMMVGAAVAVAAGCAAYYYYNKN